MEEKMTNEELNEYLARFMEYDPGESIGYAPSWYFKLEWMKPVRYQKVILISEWNPTEDRNQMAWCEEKITNPLVRGEYVNQLANICGLNNKYHVVNLYYLITASPHQRAEALYKTMEG